MLRKGLSATMDSYLNFILDAKKQKKKNKIIINMQTAFTVSRQTVQPARINNRNTSSRGSTSFSYSTFPQ